MNQSEAMRLLQDKIDDVLNSGQCGGVRFCLVVWCDCSERPKFIGGNDDDHAKTAAMLGTAREGLLAIDLQTVGNA